MPFPVRSPRAGVDPLSASSSIQYLGGPGLLDDLGPELDELHQACGAPVTARRAWLRAWLGAYNPATVWAVAVRDASCGRLDAIALLSDRDRGGWDEVSPLGRRQQDRGWLPARTPAAAHALAIAVTSRLQSRSRPWVLRLGQLPAGDPVANALADSMRGSLTLPGVPIPKVELDAPGTVEDWLGKGMRKQLRKARNRLDDDGVGMTIDFDRAPERVGHLLGEVEHTHRAREEHARRASDLDSQPGLRFWRDVIVGHAALGEVEIATLRLDGQLGAYVVSLLDGDTNRVLDGRFATSWARYSPGRLLETAVLERAHRDPAFVQVDWMNGCASEKLLVANAVDHTEHLVASSPGMVVDLDVVGRAPVPVDHRTGSNLASGAR
ncbi:MAG: GNAT family N-acetyltransferase [Actinomycetota bacterium]